MDEPDTARVDRGRQTAPPRMHWRVDGAATSADAPLVLALHGWGMDEDFFALLLQRAFERPVRFLIPRATRPAPARGVAASHPSSWYDYDGDQVAFRKELERVEAELVQLVRETEADRGWRPTRRFLIGFSQGGYCGSWVALRHPGLFHGMAVVGARVKTEFLEREMRDAAAAGFRALLLHGTRDRSVSPDAAARSHDALAAAGVDVRLRSFDAGHSVGRAQVVAIADWLTGT